MVPLGSGSTVVSYRHVLTAAAPLRNIDIRELRVYFQSRQGHVTYDNRTVSNVIFNENNPHLAIVEAVWPIAEVNISPLDISQMTVGLCRTYFFANYFGELTEANVTTLNQGCPGDAAWCGGLAVPFMCRGSYGIPIFCEGEHLAGMVYREPDCATQPPFPILSIVNLAEHADWIRGVVADSEYGGVSMNLASLAVLFAGVIVSKIL